MLSKPLNKLVTVFALIVEEMGQDWVVTSKNALWRHTMSVLYLIANSIGINTHFFVKNAVLPSITLNSSP